MFKESMILLTGLMLSAGTSHALPSPGVFANEYSAELSNYDFESGMFLDDGVTESNPLLIQTQFRQHRGGGHRGYGGGGHRSHGGGHFGGHRGTHRPSPPVYRSPSHSHRPALTPGVRPYPRIAPHRGRQNSSMGGFASHHQRPRGWTWNKLFRPSWWWAGALFPIWWWSNSTPADAWQCIAFGSFGEGAKGYVGVGYSQDDAAYNAMMACGDPKDCYIPPGYCQRR